jgi:acetolactate synthase-1/2/3 large subunit
MAEPVTAARRLVERLVAHGVERVFCVPGESYLAVLDALADVKDQIAVVACRHEAGAANMAEAHGKLTGRPGVCMVTRGPGAAQAYVGLHTASQDSTPLILFVGQVALAHKGRGAFQEMDFAAVFGSQAKWAAELDEGSRTAELVDRAFATATQGRQGPVVLALPEDVLTAPGGEGRPPPSAPARAGLDPEALSAIGARLAAAERPLIILGGSGWTRSSLQTFSDWLCAHDLPVALSFRRKDLIDNDHPCYAGDLGLSPNPQLIERLKSADVLLAIGARLGENPSQGYTLFTPEITARRLVHIHPGAEEIGRVWPPAIGAVSDLAPAALALAGLDLPPRSPEWRSGTHADWERFARPIAVDAKVNLSEIVVHMAQVLPANAIMANGAGNFAGWLHRFYRHRAFRTQLAPTSGAMGYGFPAAIAAKLAEPARDVICFAGDGDFMMSAAELATAVQYGANVVTVVVDNGSYGTIRMHQEREFPGRVIATDLRNPDFAALARSFGAWGATVDRTADFAAAFDAARAAGAPAVIHLKTDVEAIAPGRTLTALRAGRG